MGLEIASFDKEQYKIKNKRSLLVFILICFFLVLPIIVGNMLDIKYFTSGEKDLMDYYLELLFVVVMLMFPTGFVVYGIYSFVKKEIFIRLGVLDYKLTGRLAQVVAILLTILGIVFLSWFGNIFFFYGR